MRAVLIFLCLSENHSLKLLSVEGEDSAADVDADWEWESDIKFSYKPLQGKCLLKDKSAPKKTPSGDPGKFEANKLSKTTCDEAKVGTPDFKKYCEASKKSKMFEVLDAWVATLVAAETLSLLPFYIAKLCSMNMLIEDAAEAAIKAFDVNIKTAAYNLYVEACALADAAENFFCYIENMIAWLKNDPKVKNMDGEEFEIMATGTFSLVSLKYKDTRKTALELLSTIDRAGTQCGATYVQNITLQGQWVEELGAPQIQVRAQAGVPKSKALQVNFDGSWKPAAEHHYSAVQEATKKKFTLSLHDIKVFISIDSHRIHEQGIKTKRFANFLNVNLKGLSGLSGFSIGGLLGRDSHTAAAQSPEGCESTSLMNANEPTALSKIDIEM